MIMLTEVALKNLKPKEKSYKMADSGSLYIEVTPAGGKSWKLKYHYLGKEKKLTIGPYPIVSLKMAREKALEAKELLACQSASKFDQVSAFKFDHPRT
jgi:hypothetical protein